jgi:hypothetical protein
MVSVACCNLLASSPLYSRESSKWWIGNLVQRTRSQGSVKYYFLSILLIIFVCMRRRLCSLYAWFVPIKTKQKTKVIYIYFINVVHLLISQNIFIGKVG